MSNRIASGLERKSRIGRLQAQKENREWESCRSRQKSQNGKAAGPDGKSNVEKVQTHRDNPEWEGCRPRRKARMGKLQVQTKNLTWETYTPIEKIQNGKAAGPDKKARI